METLNDKIVFEYFKEIAELSSFEGKIDVIVVTHILPDRHFFLAGVSKVANILTIIPKPKSIIPSTLHWLEQKYNVTNIKRPSSIEYTEFRREIKKYITKTKNPIVLLDIGGFFSQVCRQLKDEFGDKILGIVEDTENGTQKYEKISKLNFPIVSVARSPLKKPEDFLVGQSIVFSVEAILREQSDILHGKTACVIGYGKIGRSIANLLNSRYVRTVVYDKNPITSVEALSHGFTVAPNLKYALKGAGLVFCATGNLALKDQDYLLLENGAYVATVTSSEDELDTSYIKKNYYYNHFSDYLTRFRHLGHEFFILNRGQAVNFIHGAAVGPFIYLIQGEILASIKEIMINSKKKKILENNDLLRERIAIIWMKYFGQFKQTNNEGQT